MSVIDGSNLIMGRLATNVAKRILKNERIDIVNAEKIVMTGSKVNIMEKFVTKSNLAVKGNPRKGPKFPRMPIGIVRYAIRGMLPWKTSKGKSAFKNLKVHVGVPKEFSDVKAEKIETAMNKKEKGFLTIGEISKNLGAKW